ncbi:MAG: hypothetical protein O3B08_12725, partial [Proteobacteria bacterium]|nr:hypothetical protein [Pseudomonadota bacterium]
MKLPPTRSIRPSPRSGPFWQEDNVAYRLGVDIGGTFTDFALVDEATGALTSHKQLPTPHDPSVSVL